MRSASFPANLGVSLLGKLPTVTLAALLVAMGADAYCATQPIPGYDAFAPREHALGPGVGLIIGRADEGRGPVRVGSESATSPPKVPSLSHSVVLRLDEMTPSERQLLHAPRATSSA